MRHVNKALVTFSLSLERGNEPDKHELDIEGLLHLGGVCVNRIGTDDINGLGR
jgi:hypothetical protein